MYLLSFDEVMEPAYGFSSDDTSTKTREAVNTVYAAGGGEIASNEMKSAGSTNGWWLRSIGYNSRSAMEVVGRGGVGWGSSGHSVYNLGVRPALHIDLKALSSGWSHAGTVNSEGEVTEPPASTETPAPTETPTSAPTKSPRAYENIYSISTGNDWDELLRGNMDPVNWMGDPGDYRGTDNVRIILDNNIVVGEDSIRLISTDITFTLDLNGYSLIVPGGTLSVKSSGADGIERTGGNTFILKNGTMDAAGIDTAGGMKKIEIQQVDFVNMNGDAVLCDKFDEGSVSGCTFSHAAGSNTDTAIHVSDSGTIQISNVVVSGYGIGLQCGPNAQMEIADIEVKDCGTGLKGGRFSGLRMDNASDSYIHDCDYGIDCDELVLTDTNLHVYDCKETGVWIHDQLTGPRLLEIYNCKDGLITDGSLVSQVHLQIHDNTGNGLAYTGSDITIDTSMEIYDNGGWNIYSNNLPSRFCVGNDPTGEFTCRLENGGLGNMNINPGNSSGSGYMLEPTYLKSDGSVYYVYPGKEVCISPQSSSSWTDATDWLVGCMVFDTGTYAGESVAAYVPEENIRTVSDRQDDTWDFVRTHFFAAKKGWVIRYDQNAPANMSAHPLVFAEGCNVTYDYETNGGTGMSETYSKITCLDGEAVDLSLTADRPGYEFIGWNTDPDATEGLETLAAGTTDITLYAIYKKTVYISYHTYDAGSDYRAAVTFYNNEDEKESGLAAYNAGGDNTFVGYVLNEDATVSSADDVLAAGDNVTVSSDGLDIYCVYKKQGQLDYLKQDGSVLSTERDTVYETGSDNKEFEYTVRAGEPVTGFTFKEWKDAAGNSFAAGNTIRTEDKHITLTPVYEVYKEPTTEAPAPTVNPTPDPGVVATPEPTSPSERPAETGKPTETASPATEKPTETVSPATEKPTGTASPATEKPTSDPGAVKTPEPLPPSERPDETEKPTGTEIPSATATPTADPGAVKTPEPTSPAGTTTQPSGTSSPISPGTGITVPSTADSDSDLKLPTKAPGKVGKLTGKGKKRAVWLKWKKVSGATGYEIWISTSKKFKKKTVKKTKASKITVKKLKKKKTYYIKVRTYTMAGGKVKYGKWSKIKKVKTKA